VQHPAFRGELVGDERPAAPEQCAVTDEPDDKTQPVVQ
jgi:hypothetical protein